MKITEITLTEQQLKDRDYSDRYEIKIDGISVFAVADGEPEDNTLSRNFNDVYKIQEIIEIVYEAGKNGEELIFEGKNFEDE